MITTNRKLRADKYWIVTTLLILIKLFLHLSTNTSYELHRDEMLYFRENGSRIFLCTDPKTSIQEIYKQKALAEKKVYR